jgi:hypothetical protein
MTASNDLFNEMALDGQTVTIPTEIGWAKIAQSGVFLGTPIYSDLTKELVTNLLHFIAAHGEWFRAGLIRVRGLRPWIVLPLLRIEDRLQRVHIEYLTCGKCGRRATTANPTEPTLYFTAPDERVALERAWVLPRVGCPNCGVPFSRVTVWAELIPGEVR